MKRKAKGRRPQVGRSTSGRLPPKGHKNAATAGEKVQCQLLYRCYGKKLKRCASAFNFQPLSSTNCKARRAMEHQLCFHPVAVISAIAYMRIINFHKNTCIHTRRQIISYATTHYIMYATYNFTCQPTLQMVHHVILLLVSWKTAAVFFQTAAVFFQTVAVFFQTACVFYTHSTVYVQT